MGISMDHVQVRMNGLMSRQNMNGDSAGAKEWRGAMASKQGESAGTAYELLYRRRCCRQQYTWPGAAATAMYK